jgi:hypothetical protein
MMGLFNKIFPPPPPPPEPPPAEGALDDVEQLAIFLGVGFIVTDPPTNRVGMLAAWGEHRDAVRDGYRRRARRLLAAWKR